MYSSTDLRREIENLIREDLEAGNVVVRGWVVNAILKRHPLPPMPDRDFNDFCRKGMVAEEVRAILKNWRKQDDDPEYVAEQGTLLGFKRLRLGYPMEREKKLVLVPIIRMTRAEGLAKRDKYWAMSEGCREHGDELDRYFASEPPPHGVAA